VDDRIDTDVDTLAIHEELERARADFHQLLDAATSDDLARRTTDTRWTNEQLLFHMLFGYLIVLRLLVLVRMFSRMPAGMSHGYARLLNAATRPFDLVNYLGPRGAVHVYGPHRMPDKFDRVIAALHRHLSAETATGLRRGMHYPTRWDPFFTDFMTLADLYRYPTRHYDFHRRQLTLADPRST